ncbi:hypothetical protein LCGC14_0889910 [marine sediment metagenome]|uniref:Uncharacterized protein n=1 Tax=marine sediment metagenome TaxID=412755 RepID=A0A0F9S6K6_9ZZZZ
MRPAHYASGLVLSSFCQKSGTTVVYEKMAPDQRTRIDFLIDSLYSDTCDQMDTDQTWLMNHTDDPMFLVINRAVAHNIHDLAMRARFEIFIA